MAHATAQPSRIGQPVCSARVGCGPLPLLCKPACGALFLRNLLFAPRFAFLTACRHGMRAELSLGSPLSDPMSLLSHHSSPTLSADEISRQPEHDRHFALSIVDVSLLFADLVRRRGCSPSGAGSSTCVVDSGQLVCALADQHAPPPCGWKEPDKSLRPGCRSIVDGAVRSKLCYHGVIMRACCRIYAKGMAERRTTRGG